DLFVYNPTNGAWVRVIGDDAASDSAMPALTTQFAGSWSAGWTVTIARLNNDGLSDAFVYNTALGVWFMCFSTSDGRSFTYIGGQWSAGWSIVPGDFNSDGLTDVFVYNAASGLWAECWNNGAGFDTSAVSRWSPGWQVQSADLDGDGRSDLVLYS